jgi:hypothetical protein
MSIIGCDGSGFMVPLSESIAVHACCFARHGAAAPRGTRAAPAARSTRVRAAANGEPRPARGVAAAIRVAKRQELILDYLQDRPHDGRVGSVELPRRDEP